MGWQLVAHCQAHAPASLTWRELYVLCVLADAAFESGDQERECQEGIEQRADIIERLRCSRTQRFMVIAALIQVHRGQKYVKAIYAIPDFQRPANRDPESQRPANRDPERSQRPANRDPERSQRPANRDPENDPQRPANRDPVLLISKKEVQEISRSRSTTTPSSLPGFDEFYAAYPRHEAPGDAKKAWPAALKRAGGDEQVIIKGALAYRDARDRAIADAGRQSRARAALERKYTKLPATWLRADCWEDEHEPEPDGDSDRYNAAAWT